MIRKSLLLVTVFFALTFSSIAQNNCDDSTLFYEAVQFHEKGQLDKAIEKYTEQINKCKVFSEAYINRGFCYYNENKIDNAHQDFTLAVQVSNNKAETLHSIAEVFFSSKMYDTAFVMYEQVSKLDTNNSDAYFKMGRCKWLERIPVLEEKYDTDYMKDPEYKAYLKDEILNLFDKAIFLDSVQNYKLYKSRGDNSLEAAQDMETNYQYYYYRGMFKMNFLDFQGALKDFEQSLFIHPTINGYKFAASLAKKVGQNKKACNYIQTWAMLMDPAQPENVFKKHDIADKFCKELGIEKK